MQFRLFAFLLALRVVVALPTYLPYGFIKLTYSADPETQLARQRPKGLVARWLTLPTIVSEERFDEIIVEANSDGTSKATEDDKKNDDKKTGKHGKGSAHNSTATLNCTNVGLQKSINDTINLNSTNGSWASVYKHKTCGAHNSTKTGIGAHNMKGNGTSADKKKHDKDGKKGKNETHNSTGADGIA